MAEFERRQRTISSTPRLTSDDVANRKFAKAVRGVSESEVRSFLRRVSEELTQARDRENELANAVDALEEQLRAPRPLDEQELLDALGEETARLLRSAREAAEDIRKHSEERAATLVERDSGQRDSVVADATKDDPARDALALVRGDRAHPPALIGLEPVACYLDGFDAAFAENRHRGNAEAEANRPGPPGGLARRELAEQLDVPPDDVRGVGELGLTERIEVELGWADEDVSARELTHLLELG
jgi:DivIVA domain-containing protein